ncbi:MAG: hypothetical protein MUO72_09660 [Bacteroidales bacterium]|nr:hypothetical protein [Bacteroidales bacterium]
MKTEFKLITPAIAEDLLRKNPMNRTLRERLINEYSRQMSAGLWKEETGESLKLAFDGTILDGQHRLLALIKANVKLSFLLITGLDKEVFTVLDTGTTRTAGDIFHIAGVTQSNNHAAIITKYLSLKSGSTAVLLGSGGHSGGGSMLKNIKFSKAELFSVYNNRKKFWESSLLMADHWYTQFQRVLTLSEIGGLYAYLYDIDNDDAFTFIDSLCSGVELDRTNPIKLLREKLIFSKTNLKFKLTPVQKLGLIYKAWNYFRKKTQISVLRFSRELDNFPIVI